MKTVHLTLCLLCFFTLTPLFSQLSFGVKGGVNYDSFGDLTASDVSLSSFEADANTGFHLGVFTNIDLLTFYLRPELQFSKSESNIINNGRLALNKIEAPVLLGYKALGPLSVFAGPAFQYIVSEKGKNVTLGALKENFTVGLQLGTRLKLGRFGIDIRFERGFTDNEILLLGNNDIDVAGRADTRAKQWIVSASYDLRLKSKRQNKDKDDLN